MQFILLALLTVVSFPATTHQFTDGDFHPADWTTTIFAKGGGTCDSQLTQIPAGGNPGNHGEIRNIYNGDYPAVLGFHAKTTAVYDPSVSGPIVSISYSEDYLFVGKSGSSTGGQRAGLALMQDGVVYRHEGYLGGEPSSWTNHSFPVIAQADFARVRQVDALNYEIDAGVNPDFSATGGPITFGFYRTNSTPYPDSENWRTASIDNWSVTLEVQPVAGHVQSFGDLKSRYR